MFCILNDTLYALLSSKLNSTREYFRDIRIFYGISDIFCLHDYSSSFVFVNLMKGPFVSLKTVNNSRCVVVYRHPVFSGHLCSVLSSSGDSLKLSFSVFCLLLSLFSLHLIHNTPCSRLVSIAERCFLTMQRGGATLRHGHRQMLSRRAANKTTRKDRESGTATVTTTRL